VDEPYGKPGTCPVRRCHFAPRRRSQRQKDFYNIFKIKLP